jgi:DNA polymerase
MSLFEKMPGSQNEAHAQAASCQRCHLCRNATQTLLGEGAANAKVTFVGEQTGDHEDVAGRPFVGPAGRLFDDMLSQAGIDRARVYVTNAVMHFKHERRSTYRLNKKLDTGEIHACRRWLDIEHVLVRPRLIVALGTTATQSLTGNGATILKRRGKFEFTREGERLFITIRPSMVLRIPDAGAARQACDEFRRDLEQVAAAMKKLAAA